MQDLYSIPMLLQFNPAVISVEDVRQGGFLSGGTQEIAIVERVDKERGQAIISATRMPNTPGVSGSGTLVGVVIKGLAPGNSQLSIVQVNAKDSQQRPDPGGHQRSRHQGPIKSSRASSPCVDHIIAGVHRRNSDAGLTLLELILTCRNSSDPFLRCDSPGAE